jgi:hypothetical protein
MGKRPGGVLIALLAATWGFAQIQHEVSVVNISVPVRVFEGEKFVDSLKLEDFEVYEDGKLQPIEAVYLIRGSDVRRQEGPAKAPAPATSRFEHKFVVLGPVELFGDEAQKIHDYRIAGETNMEGEPALVIDVRPMGTGRSSLYGKAWVRERDGAVLKVEWEPVSMGNYAAIEKFAKASRAQPRIRFSSEYGFEKNGLRFPNAYEVIEAYRTPGRTVTLSRTSVVYKDYKFFEVKVRTEIRRAG